MEEYFPPILMKERLNHEATCTYDTASLSSIVQSRRNVVAISNHSVNAEKLGFAPMYVVVHLIMRNVDTFQTVHHRAHILKAVYNVKPFHQMQCGCVIYSIY